ncbi:acyltransferase [Photobacterium damselae]|uniref:acyltransferase n=1 Tax=Photobacterium damselae TaxID=38293 RepID=UPI00406803F7
MSYCYKVFWFIRALFFKFILGKVGFFTIIGKPIFLYNPKRIDIGNKVRIFPNSRFECHNNGRIVIRDNVSIGQNFHVTSTDESLIINSGVIISGNVCITNIDHQYSDIATPVSEQPLIFSETLIGEDSFIGYGAVIQAGTRLGKHCVVGANSTVKGDFPDYSVIVGSPGKVVKTFNHETGLWENVNKNA